MSAVDILSLEAALAELQEAAPDAPFLALGQTVFWDEPMKGGLALASSRLGFGRRLVAGVHDTDYFAKLPSGKHATGRFKALPHNDTTTRGFWSAAGEFSSLFGSETVVSREALTAAGVPLEKLEAARPGILDSATEAWGWRGIASLDEHPPVIADLPIASLISELTATFDWALDASLACIAGEGRAAAERVAEELRSLLCDTFEQHRDGTLSDFYRALLPPLYEIVATRRVPLETAATSELLRFNRQTCGLPRFDLLRRFVEPETREKAGRAYDEAIAGSGLYDLARFGTGAIPFDLFIPGIGRGTVRLASRAIVIMTPRPQFVNLRRPVGKLEELAEAIERKFGPDCTLVGKAVTLIGMLAREFVFVFHEGASSYVRHSRELHRNLAGAGLEVPLNPVLRIRYQPWDALQVGCSWLRLPEPLQRAFGTEELCAPSFARRWQHVVDEQESLLQSLGELRRPIELIRFLDERLGGAWKRIASEYQELHRHLEAKMEGLEKVREERRSLYRTLSELKRSRVEAERRKGDQFRAAIFEKNPAKEDLAERQRLSDLVDAIIHQIVEVGETQKELMRRQTEIAKDPEILAVHERRRAIEVEAELKRLRLARNAWIAVKGLRRAGERPTAWWFPLVCSDGLWFRETTESAEYYLEPLS